MRSNLFRIFIASFVSISGNLAAVRALVFQFVVIFVFAAGASAITLQLSPNSTTSSSTPLEADYSSTHLFIDEINGDSIPIYIYFDPQTTSGTVDEADVFTNLNNRDRANLDANGDGIPDAIIPPNGNLILAGSSTPNYFQAYKMNGTGPFNLVLYANKTGAYRITARYHLQGEGPNTFHWYGDFLDGGGTYNFRDAAIVVSPTKARSMTMYELNALNIDAEGPSSYGDSSTRSTFDYFDNGPNAPQNQTPPQTPRPFNLNYVQGLGVNWLWLQPVHPIGIQGRQTDEASGQVGTVGSPYSVKNFFAINSLFSKTFVPGVTDENTGRANALVEFQRFVKAADAMGINIMLDVPFNHTAFDCELGPEGQILFGDSASSLMENTHANIYSRWNGGSADQTNSANWQNFDYGARAFSASSIPLAADRYDFGKFIDVHDIYFGNYAALVDVNSTDTNPNDNPQDYFKYKNEGDWFDYSIGPGGVSNDGVDAQFNSGNGHFDSITQNMWKYFAAYIPYWLQMTGHTDSNGNLVGNSTLSDPVARRAADDLGLDGIRADFAQGLPPQLWEYIINYARSYKWDFVFLAESLDGGAVTYRSNRHFDVENENVLFDFYGAQVTSDFRAIFDGRRNTYGQGLVLWDTESHDEAGYTDPYLALMRYAVSGTIDGVPDIFYGQEIGISGAVTPPNSNSFGTPYGFTTYQVNFGKPIPDFMSFNSLVNAWNALGTDANGQAHIYPVYSAIGQARLSSAALQSSNRYYLNQIGGSIQQSIFSVAKYQTANGSPATTDVVFAFANLDRNDDQQGNFDVNVTQNGSNLFGIKSNRTYDVKNIAAYTAFDPNRRTYFLNRQTGANLVANGLFVGMKKVPTSDSGWQTAPYEAQYLKVYDVTAPSTTPGTAAPPNSYFYGLGNSVNVSWTAAPPDSEGVVPCYKVIVTVTINNTSTTTSFVTCSTSATLSSATVGQTLAVGQTLTVTIETVNPSDNSVTGPSSAPVNIKLLDPNGDEDGDGMTNAQEDAAGTNPFDPNSVFRVTNIARPDSSHVTVTWSSVSGKVYVLQSASAPGGTYTDVTGSQLTASGATTSETIAASGPPAFYRVRLGP